MTIQWPKEKNNNLQNTTKKTKHWVTGTPQKAMVSQIWWKVKVLHVGLPIGKIVTILSQQDLIYYLLYGRLLLIRHLLLYSMEDYS
jgi:hypothetical protein